MGFTIGPASDVSAQEAGRYKSYPSAVTCGDGSVLCAYRDGTGHGTGGDVRLIRYTEGAWGESSLLYSCVSDFNQWQACSITRRESDGRLFLYARRYIVGAELADQNRIYVAHSDDEGATWSEQQMMTPNPLGEYEHTCAFADHAGKLVQLTGGALLMAAYGFRGGDSVYYSTAIMQSQDGIAWTHRAWVGGGDAAGYHCSENNIIKLADGRLLCMMRVADDVVLSTSMRQSYSSDDGMTWSEPATLNAGIAGTAPVVRRFADDGSLFLLYDTNLVAFRFSEDHGSSWSAATHLATYSNMPQNGGYGELVMNSDGLIHAIYYLDDDNDAPWIQERIITIS